MTLTDQNISRAVPFVFVILWSSAFVATRAGLPDISPLLFLTLRFAIAAVVLISVAALFPIEGIGKDGGLSHLVVAGVLMNALYLSGVYLALKHIPASTMALIGSLHPLLTAIAAGPMLGERLRAVQWIGLALGIVGVVIVLGLEFRRPSDLVGPALGFSGVISLVLGTLYYRKYCREIPLRGANTVQLASAAVVCAVLTLLGEDASVTWTPSTVGTLFYLALVVSLGAPVMLMFMLRHGKAGKVASNFYLTPGITALLGWLFLGEVLEPRALLGLAVTSVGVWLAYREEAM